MKAALQSHLNPEEEAEKTPAVTSEKSPADDLPWKDEAPAKAFTLSTQKTDIDQKIDDLFNI